MISNDCSARTSTCSHLFVAFLAAAVARAAWADDRVPIPRPEQDQAPVITVNAVASGGGADFQYGAASPSICASPCKNGVKLQNKNGTANIVLTITAQNPKGGVQDLSVVISQNGPLYSVSRRVTPNAQNLVPVSLPILGTDRKGGIGGNPLLIRLNKTKTNATVVVEAGNYNRQRSIYAVTYYVPGQVTAKLSASKNEIYTDEATTLKWETKNAESLQITPSEGLPKRLEPNGSAQVRRVGGPGTTRYTLTARNWLETATSSVTIKFDKRPNIGGSLFLDLNFTCASGQVYANATFNGECDSLCDPSGTPNSKGMFKTSPVTENISCNNSSGGVSTWSPPNLTPGHWKVWVTPLMPTIQLTGQSPSCGISTKAGENHSVIFDYRRDPQTGGWAATCRTR